MRRLLKSLLRSVCELPVIASLNNPTWGPVPGVKTLSLPSIYIRSRGIHNSVEFSPSWQAVRVKPEPINGLESSEFDKELIHSLPASSGAVVTKGRVLGFEGVIFDSNGYLLAEPSRTIGRGPQDWSELYRFKRPVPLQLPGTWGVLTGAGSSGYFHWMLDVLPKVQTIKSMGVKLDGWIIPRNETTFVEETLHLAGVNGPFIHIGPQQQIVADNLVVASPPSESGNPPPWVRQFYESVRDSQTEQSKTLRKLYISRNRSRCRRIRNESNLLSRILPLGFEVFYLEDLSVAAQLQLFSCASAIIAPHGAGLSNLVFSPSTARVLELFSDRYVNVCYWSLTCLYGMQYAYILTQGISSGSDPCLDDLTLSEDNLQCIEKWAINETS